MTDGDVQLLWWIALTEIGAPRITSGEPKVLRIAGRNLDLYREAAQRFDRQKELRA